MTLSTYEFRVLGDISKAVARVERRLADIEARLPGLSDASEETGVVTPGTPPPSKPEQTTQQLDLAAEQYDSLGYGWAARVCRRLAAEHRAEAGE